MYKRQCAQISAKNTTQKMHPFTHHRSDAVYWKEVRATDNRVSTFTKTRSSATAKEPREGLFQLKSCHSCTKNHI